jgi:predicted short-subunit dehydrogenase-like oxidoreductase (DUF2520 family)
MQKPTIAIIGPGRAGSALGRALRKSGYTIAAIGGRNPDNVRNLADELGAKACQSPATAIDLAELTIVAVPDDVILPLATDMSAGPRIAAPCGRSRSRGASEPVSSTRSRRSAVDRRPSRMWPVPTSASMPTRCCATS